MTVTHEAVYQQKYQQLVSYLEGIEVAFEMAAKMNVEIPGHELISVISERILIIEEEFNCV